jgi:tRNA threonylcarbamoyladenosine biosynthesis protein TsaE
MPSEHDAGTSAELVSCVDDTHALASRLAPGLCAGQVLALVGELGAGKTEFTRGLVAALGVPADVTVCSPSYLLLNLYPGGRLPVAHFDAYFMDGSDDLERAGLDDLRREGQVVVIEWADRVAVVLPEDTIWIEFEPGDQPSQRRITLRDGRDHGQGRGQDERQVLA